MKKLLIYSFALFALSGFLTSCGNTRMDGAMKAPVQSPTDTINQTSSQETLEEEGEDNGDADREEDGKNSMAKPASYSTGKDAITKTMENMQAAFKGETTASAKYAAYSKRAEEEGHHQIALLFKAASTAEDIHAKNHKAVLQESGVNVPVIQPVYTVKTTLENLQDAIDGESYEVSTMYPEFLTTANAAGNQLAMMSLNYAYKTEMKHKVFYEAAFKALQNKTEKTLATVFYVCPTCGNTYETKASARCGISMTSSEKFIKISTL